MKKRSTGSKPSAAAISAAGKLALRYRITGSVKAVEGSWIALLYDLIRKGELTPTNGPSTLKALLAPFRDNLDELRALVAGMSTGMDGASTTTGHGVYAEGQELPVEGEPDDDSDDEAVRRLLGIGRKVLGRKS